METKCICFTNCNSGNTGHCICVTSTKLNGFYFICPYLYGDLWLSLESHPVSVLILPWEKPLDYVLGRFGWNQSCFSYPNKSSQSPRLLSWVQRQTWSNAKISLEVFPEQPYHWISAHPKRSAWCHFLPNCFQNNAGTAAWSSALGRDPLRHLLHIKVLIFTGDLCSWPHLSQSCTFGLQILCQDKHTVMLLTELDQTAGLAENESCNNSQPKLSFINNFLWASCNATPRRITERGQDPSWGRNTESDTQCFPVSVSHLPHVRISNPFTFYFIYI